MKNNIFLLILFWGMSSFALAQNGAIINSMLIFPTQEKHVHASSIVGLSNGDFLAVWFYGSGERTADDVKLMGARLKKARKVGLNLFKWPIRQIFLIVILYFF